MTVVRKLKAHVKRAMLNILAIARCCSATLESEGIESSDELALLREELELLHARLDRVSRPVMN